MRLCVFVCATLYVYVCKFVRLGVFVCVGVVEEMCLCVLVWLKRRVCVCWCG